jgi:hypothetical protein
MNLAAKFRSYILPVLLGASSLTPSVASASSSIGGIVKEGKKEYSELNTHISQLNRAIGDGDKAKVRSRISDIEQDVGKMQSLLREIKGTPEYRSGDDVKVPINSWLSTSVSHQSLVNYEREGREDYAQKFENAARKLDSRKGFEKEAARLRALERSITGGKAQAPKKEKHAPAVRPSSSSKAKTSDFRKNARQLSEKHAAKPHTHTFSFSFKKTFKFSL